MNTFKSSGIKFKAQVSDTEFIRKRFIFDADDPDMGEWVVNNPKYPEDTIKLRICWDAKGYWVIEVNGPIGYADLDKLLEPVSEYEVK